LPGDPDRYAGLLHWSRLEQRFSDLNENYTPHMLYTLIEK
jgi:hypothetical protein